MLLYCATSNPGKLREFRRASDVFAGGGITILPHPLIGSIEPPPETGTTFEENAILKARHYSGAKGEFLFAEDSGLEVEALLGEPGVVSARWGGRRAGDEERNRLLLERLAGVENRAARFVCSIALVKQGELVRTFRGEFGGLITEVPIGENGFGYDPVFFYPPLARTFAQLDSEEKLRVSHRGKALARLMEFLTTLQPKV